MSDEKKRWTAKENGMNLLRLQILCFFISSASMLLFPFQLQWPEITGLRIAVGALFWLGLLAGGACGWQLRRRLSQYPKFSKQDEKRPHFFSNKRAALADGCLLASLAGILLVEYLLRIHTPWPIGILLFLLVYSAQLHFVLNGKCYWYLTIHKRRKTTGEVL